MLDECQKGSRSELSGVKEKAMSNQSKNGEPLIRVSHLKQYFPINTGFFKTKPLKAVDDISFDIMEGETLAAEVMKKAGK